MLVAVHGCNQQVMHKAVQFNRCENSTSVYRCEDCGEEFVEYDDSGCGG